MPWTAFVDGGSRGNPGPGAAGVQVVDPAGRVPFEAGFFLGTLTNNQAEYGGLLAALDVIERAGADDVVFISDSQLMVRQILGEYRVKSEDLRPLYERARAKLARLRQWDIRHVLREGNTRADALANMAMDRQADVIVRDVLGGAPTRAETISPSSSTGSVEVLVVQGPKRGTCRAGTKKGARYRLGAFTPAGLCVDSGAELLAAVRGTQARQGAEQATVRCPRPGCGAVFAVRYVPEPADDQGSSS
jgi:ribonuclease HI